MKTWQGILLGTFLGLAAAAILTLVVLPPRGEPIVLPPTPSPAAIAVYVIGAVNTPGVVYIPHQSRVLNAIEAAGGFSTDADADAVNLAARVTDGERISILSRSASATKTALTSTASAANVKGGTIVTPSVVFPINLNTATQAELEALPTIGPTKAAQIMAYRQKIGTFIKIEEIQNVPGIGPETFEKIKDLITLQD
jgi:competence protein ComEA